MKKINELIREYSKKNQTFEEYLMEVFMENYNGTKDQVEDVEEVWFENLDPQELIDYGDAYGKRMYEMGKYFIHNDKAQS